MPHLLLLLSAFLCIISGCTNGNNTKERTESFHISSPTDPTSFDPRVGRDLITLNVCQQLFSSLARYDRHGKLVLDLAKEIIAEDEQTYLITLNDAVWSDGRPITAYDVRYSWLSLLDPNRMSPHAFDLYIIRGAKEFHDRTLHEGSVKITVLNDKEIRVQLKNRCPCFKALLAMPGLAIIQAHFDQEVGTWNSSRTIPVSGPYKVKKYVPKNKLVLVKNPNYKREADLLYETVVIHFIDDSTSISMFERNDLDWCGSPFGSLITDSVEHFKKQKVLHHAPAAGTAFLRVNTIHPYLSDKNFRKALSHAIQRDSIVQRVLLAGYEPAYSLIPPCLFRQDSNSMKDIEQTKREELAKEYLKAFCKKTGRSPKDITIRLSFPSSNEKSRRVAQVLQQNFQDVLGIRIDLSPYDSQLYLQKIASLDYDLGIGSWFADFMSPFSFVSVFENKSNGTNNTGWESSHYQGLMKHLLESKTGSTQEQLIYTSLLNTLQEDSPIIPLYYFSYVYAKKPSVQEIGFSPLGHFDFLKE